MKSAGKVDLLSTCSGDQVNMGAASITMNPSSWNICSMVDSRTGYAVKSYVEPSLFPILSLQLQKSLHSASSPTSPSRAYEKPKPHGKKWLHCVAAGPLAEESRHSLTPKKWPPSTRQAPTFRTMSRNSWASRAWHRTWNPRTTSNKPVSFGSNAGRLLSCGQPSPHGPSLPNHWIGPCRPPQGIYQDPEPMWLLGPHTSG